MVFDSIFMEAPLETAIAPLASGLQSLSQPKDLFVINYMIDLMSSLLSRLVSHFVFQFKSTALHAATY